MNSVVRHRRTIYLASPYGFSAQWKRLLLPEFVSALESLDWMCGNCLPVTARWMCPIRLGTSSGAQRDLQDVRDADALFAIVNGTPPDEGVMVELGAAIALGKPTFLFRDDFRRCTDSEDYPLNLMLFAGLPAQGWQDFVYRNLDEIGDPAKALAVWACQV